MAVLFGAGNALAAVIPTHRQCTVEIKNDCRSYCLINPSVCLTSGGCSKPLPLKLNPATRNKALFAKTPHTARGTVGVFTYDLCKTGSIATEKIAVMFSVPYDFNLYSNWYAVGVFSCTKSCDYDLYCEMYYNNESGFVRGKAADGSLQYKQRDVVIKASMSDTYTPYLKLKVKQI
ncbi:unnamed protein product [Lota lota]